MHGALKKDGTDRRVKHGLRSKYKGALVKERLERAQDDPQLTNMRFDIAILRALQDRKLDQLKAALPDKEGANIEAVDAHLQAVHQLTVSVIAAIERYEKTQNRPENMVPITVLGEIIEVFARSVNEAIEDAHARKLLLRAIDRGLRIHTPPTVH